MKLSNGNFYSFTGESKHLFGYKWVAFKRYVALLLWCFVILALYFTYDVPGSLQNHIMKQFQLSSLQFSYLYSVYSWPNIVMCFLGGYLIDRVFGPKLGLIIYVSVATIGVTLFVIGGNIDSFPLMLVGRFVIGIGTESSVVALNNYTVLWFTGKELNMVFAIVMNIGRIGSSLVFEGSENIRNAIAAAGVPQEKVLGRTLIALGCVILIALIGSLFAALLDPEKREEDVKDQKQDEKQPEKSEEKLLVKFSDVFTFPLQYWLLCIITDIYINCLYSFLGLSQASFTSKFNVSNETANRYVSFFSFFGAVLSPVLGIMIDKKGRNLSYVTFAIVTGIIAFALLAFTSASPYVSMVFLAISVACILSSVWALFSYIIPEHQLGMAFGLLQAILNIMFSVGSIAAGAIADKYGSEIMEAYMMLLIIATIPLLIWSWVEDIRRTKILNMSSMKRVEFLKKLKQTDTGLERKISTISKQYSLENNKTVPPQIATVA